MIYWIIWNSVDRMWLTACSASERIYRSGERTSAKRYATKEQGQAAARKGDRVIPL